MVVKGATKAAPGTAVGQPLTWVESFSPSERARAGTDLEAQQNGGDSTDGKDMTTERTSNQHYVLTLSGWATDQPVF